MARTHASRFASTGLYGGCLLWAAGHFALPQVLGVALAMFMPLAVIWYPQEFNELALGALQKNGVLETPLPAWVVELAGWLLLLSLPLLAELIAAP